MSYNVRYEKAVFLIGKSVLEDKYAVATVPSTKRLFSLLEKIVPALILLDVYIPEMDGFEAITLLKTKPETREIPVIFPSFF